MKFLLLIFSFTIISCSTKSKDCSDFKIGTFEYKDSNLSDWLIVRNEFIQIEFNEKENIRLIGSIEWLTNCKYILTYKEVSNNPQDKIIGKKIKVNIIETYGNSYKYEAYSNSFKTSEWMIKTGRNEKNKY